MLFISEKNGVTSALQFAKGTKFAVDKMAPDTMLSGYVDDTVALMETVLAENDRKIGFTELRVWLGSLMHSCYVPAQEFARKLSDILDEEK
jgi:hypothetical protein